MINSLTSQSLGSKYFNSLRDEFDEPRYTYRVEKKGNGLWDRVYEEIALALSNNNMNLK